jgi:two-component system C4-dicarboxylate transport sensor histidine kinase DctB
MSEPRKLEGDAGWVRVAQLAELGVLTASLLHELRQPLFAIRATAQLRRAQGRDLDAADITTVLDNLRHVDELLDHYSGFSRVEGPRERFDLRVPIGQATAMLSHRCSQEDVTLQVSMPEQMLPVYGRAGAVRQVLVNLLQNALDAVSGMPERTIAVDVTATSELCTLVLVDSGPGVPEADRQRLFEPFYTTKAEGQGTGLGLFIARRLVEELGGTIALDGEGFARVVLCVPLV